MNVFMLIPIVVGIICAILGYLIGRLGKKNNHDNTDYTREISRLETALEACKKSKSSINTATSSAPSKKESTLFNTALAKEVFGKKVKENDLTIVEGIGPKISQLFYTHNVKTWKDLSECSVEKCKDVLKSGGDRFKMHVPGTWPEQSRLAYQGKWKELLKWQDELNGGKNL